VTTQPRLQYSILRVERWDKDEKVYKPFSESRVQMTSSRKFLFDSRGRKYDPATGKCLARFFPGQLYRYSLKVFTID
jgi:hypothetical protein